MDAQSELKDDNIDQTTDGDQLQTKDDNQNTREQKTTINDDDYIPKTEFKRVLSDMHKFKTRYRELESKLKERDMTELKKREEWQKLADHFEKESQQYREQFEGLQTALVRDKKISEVKNYAIKSGIRQEALEDLEILDMDDVQIETTSTGRYNVLGADKFVNRLKVNRPHWFGKTYTGVNTKDPEVVKAESVSYEQIKKIADKARRTGDYSEYERALKKYRQASS